MTTNYEHAFEERPDVYAAWGELLAAIKANMDLRRYELERSPRGGSTRATALSLTERCWPSSLGSRFTRSRGIIALGLDDLDVAVMDLAERVVDDASSIGEADLQRLHDLGLSDAEVMDVVLAAAARCFFAKTIDAMGVLPDASYRELAPELREVLVVGRPIAES